VEGDIVHDWLIWKSTFLTTVADHIPTKRLRSRKYVPWLTGEILLNIKRKFIKDKDRKNLPQV
jgi:hypothetical protein